MFLPVIITLPGAVSNDGGAAVTFLTHTVEAFSKQKSLNESGDLFFKISLADFYFLGGTILPTSNIGGTFPLCPPGSYTLGVFFFP